MHKKFRTNLLQKTIYTDTHLLSLSLSIYSTTLTNYLFPKLFVIIAGRYRNKQLNDPSVPGARIHGRHRYGATSGSSVTGRCRSTTIPPAQCRAFVATVQQNHEAHKVPILSKITINTFISQLLKTRKMFQVT